MWNLFRRSQAKPASAAISPVQVEPMTLEDVVPIGAPAEERIAMATHCRDSDIVPKVAGAGQLTIGPDGTKMQIMHNGLLVLAGGYHGEWMQRLITLCSGHHEPQEERAFHEVVRSLAFDATMIELGRFWSYYTLWFLKGEPRRRAVVLEPDPAHLKVGKTNSRLNRLRPTFVHGFVGATSRPPSPFETEDSGRMDVPCFSVPDLMTANGIDILDLLHCDVQGAEFDTLRGCEGIFRDGRVTWVFVSTHVYHISGDPLTHQRCLAVLKNAGATIVAEHDVHESFSGDGLILAKFGSLPSIFRPLALSYNRYSTSLFRNPLYDLAQVKRACRLLEEERTKGVLATRTHENLLKLVIGMAISRYAHDPKLIQSDTARQIADDLAIVGVELDPATISSYLRASVGMLPRGS